jgi:hypothetical protein
LLPVPAPTLQPSHLPTTPAPTQEPTISWPGEIKLGEFFFDKVCLSRNLEDVNEISEFMDYMASALRIEACFLSTLCLLFLLILAQLGGIPNVRKGGSYSLIGLFLWALWMLALTIQIVTTFLSLLMAILATFSMIAQHRDCFMDMANGWAFFICILPSLVMHPTMVSKLIALWIYTLSIAHGLRAASCDRSVEIVRRFCFALTFLIGLFSFVYQFFSASFVFSGFFFVPVFVASALVFSFFFGILKRLRKASDVRLENHNTDASTTGTMNRIIDPESNFGLEMVFSGDASEIDEDESGPPPSSKAQSFSINPFRVLKGSLWWIDQFDSPEYQGAYWSSVLLASSPMLLFGAWAAFYCYLGHDPATNMDYISLEYRTFFGCFFDLAVRLPALFEFNFTFLSLSRLGRALMDLPSFESLPPSAMLEGSKAFAALSFISAFLKPIVSAIGLVLEFTGCVEKRITVGELAEASLELEGSFKVSGGDAKKLAHLLGKTSIKIVANSSGGVKEVSIVKKETAFALKSFMYTPAVVSINLSGCGSLATGTCFYGC